MRFKNNPRLSEKFSFVSNALGDCMIDELINLLFERRGLSLKFLNGLSLFLIGLSLLLYFLILFWNALSLFLVDLKLQILFILNPLDVSCRILDFFILLSNLIENRADLFLKNGVNRLQFGLILLFLSIKFLLDAQ